ncbi:MAG TPA: DNA recombination protein RmuC [Candidatus Jorgensenbacteria bacterium]|uniref:DNA recombination protein RmuC n=1 Tax=marine sediment metagenome TaxID=412755 RepID=A0A0F9A4A1_9ZZZZ|nr:DNA recombination protein RmuC [Candidatus Jorgensenbacteria bacterium]
MNVETLLIIVLSAVILGFGGLFYVLLYRRNEKPKENEQPFLLLQNEMQDIRKTMRETLETQFGESKKLIKDVTKQLTEVQETNKQVFNITDQLRNLEQVFKNQKQRGSIGEAGLELVLSNTLSPDAYEMQHTFSNGTVVDAVIITKEGMIPVDAKFSLDNYIRIMEEEDEEKRKVLEKEFRNDLKRRIDETAKYIQPKEGTLPFAFMYIPAEPIYYDLLVNKIGAIKSNTRSLIDYAYIDKHVMVVSPTTFSAYLQSVLYGFRAFKIEESAKEIGKSVEKLGRHIGAYEEYYRKLGNSLGTTVSHYNAAYKELKKIDKDVLRISSTSAEIEPLELEKPQEE